MTASARRLRCACAMAVDEEAVGGGAGVGEGQALVEQHDAAPALLDDGAEALLAPLQLVLRAAALGDVADEGGEGLFGAAADGIDGDLDGKQLAAGAAAEGFDAALGVISSRGEESPGGGGSFAVGACPERAKRVEWAAQDDTLRYRPPEDVAR